MRRPAHDPGIREPPLADIGEIAKAHKAGAGVYVKPSNGGRHPVGLVLGQVHYIAHLPVGMPLPPKKAPPAPRTGVRGSCSLVNTQV